MEDNTKPNFAIGCAYFRSNAKGKKTFVSLWGTSRGEETDPNDLFVELRSLLNFIHLSVVSEGILVEEVLQDPRLVFRHGDQDGID